MLLSAELSGTTWIRVSLASDTPVGHAYHLIDPRGERSWQVLSQVSHLCWSTVTSQGKNKRGFVRV